MNDTNAQETIRAYENQVILHMQSRKSIEDKLRYYHTNIRFVQNINTLQKFSLFKEKFDFYVKYLDSFFKTWYQMEPSFRNTFLNYLQDKEKKIVMFSESLWRDFIQSLIFASKIRLKQPISWIVGITNKKGLAAFQWDIEWDMGFFGYPRPGGVPRTPLSIREEYYLMSTILKELSKTMSAKEFKSFIGTGPKDDLFEREENLGVEDPDALTPKLNEYGMDDRLGSGDQNTNLIMHINWYILCGLETSTMLKKREPIDIEEERKSLLPFEELIDDVIKYNLIVLSDLNYLFEIAGLIADEPDYIRTPLFLLSESGARTQSSFRLRDPDRPTIQLDDGQRVTMGPIQYIPDEEQDHAFNARLRRIWAQPNRRGETDELARIRVQREVDDYIRTRPIREAHFADWYGGEKQGGQSRRSQDKRDQKDSKSLALRLVRAMREDDINSDPPPIPSPQDPTYTFYKENLKVVKSRLNNALKKWTKWNFIGFMWGLCSWMNFTKSVQRNVFIKFISGCTYRLAINPTAFNNHMRYLQYRKLNYPPARLAINPTAFNNHMRYLQLIELNSSPDRFSGGSKSITDIFRESIRTIGEYIKDRTPAVRLEPPPPGRPRPRKPGISPIPPPFGFIPPRRWMEFGKRKSR